MYKVAVRTDGLLPMHITLFIISLVMNFIEFLENKGKPSNQKRDPETIKKEKISPSMARQVYSETELQTSRTLRLRRSSRTENEDIADNEQNIEQNVEQVQENIEENNLERRVSFTPDTIDNEHLNKKKSKVCCIFKMGKNKKKNKYER